MACVVLNTCCFSEENPHNHSNKHCNLLEQNRFPLLSLLPPDSQQDEIATNFYVWRHGETNANCAKILSGGGDTQASLTEKGKQQAVLLANKILQLKLPLQAIYSSDLLRAMETSEPILAAFANNLETIIPSPQLREILHGKYELVDLQERRALAETMFTQELYKMGSDNDSIRKKFEEERLDRFYFCKIHPMTRRLSKDEGEIIDVISFLKGEAQEPETPYELYHRIYAELVKIAEETSSFGLNDIGISTHGAVLATIINIAQYNKEDCFIPVHYQTNPLQAQGEVVMPLGVKIENCALAHFRYWHKAKYLQFCGMLH